LVSCSNSGEERSKRIFRYNESSNILTLDPAFAKNQAHIWVCNQLYNSLVDLDENLQVIPSLAKTYSVDSSGLLYSFTLRDDVYFIEAKSGKKVQKVISDDVVFSLNRIRNPKTLSPGKWTLTDVDSIWKVNDQEVKIRLKSPNPVFLSMLSMKYSSIISKDIINDIGESAYWKSPIGTGPFYFQIWKDKVKMVLRKNTSYFEKDEQGESLPYMDAISIRFIPDKLTAFLEFVKGNLDFISGIDASYKDEILDKEGNLKEKYTNRVSLATKGYLNTEYLGILVDKAEFPYNNVHFREALNLSFDRKAMMRYIRNNIGEPALSGFIPKGLPAYKEDSFYSFDKGKAMELLKQSKYIEKGSPQIEIHTNSSYLDLCEFIQKSWQDFGINAKVIVHPPSTLRQMISKQKVPIFRASWIADYPDSENYLSLFYSKNWAPNGPNYTHFLDTIFDKQYIETKKVLAGEKRVDKLTNLHNIVKKNHVVIPLYYDEVYVFYNKNICGLSVNSMNNLNVKKVKYNCD
jgi:peptide/nickel transport system substrate-binding protein